MKDVSVLKKTIRLLDKYRIEPETERDQHFMVNPDVIRRMAEEAEVRPGDTVIEIGTGLGTLTRELLERGARVISFETDKRLKPLLMKEMKSENLRLYFRDGLESIKRRKRFGKIISNIPYAICEPLINELTRKDFEIGVLTIPEGFFERLENEKTLLNLRASVFFKISLVTAVSRKDFFPTPKTDSIVIRMRKYGESDYRRRGMEFFLKELMLQRTKKLRNAMIEALINLNVLHGRKMTKRESRKVIATVKLVREFMERKVMDLTYVDYVNIKEALDFIL